jgi:hypothetical protein
MPIRAARAYQLVVLAAVWTLSGCGGFTVNQPPSTGTVLNPVSFNVTWNTSSMNSIHFAVDGSDQTSAFTIDYANQKATASISLPPAPHTLVVNGDYYFAGTLHANASSTFTVGCGAITINQPPNNGAVLDPVSFNVTWTSTMNSIRFMIDGVDQTSKFTIDFPNRKATASMTLLPGPTPHTLVVNGGCYSVHLSATSTFNVVIQ